MSQPLKKSPKSRRAQPRVEVVTRPEVEFSPGGDIALSFFKFAVKSIAKGVLGKAGEVAMGGLLSAVFGGEDLDQQQVQELQQINRTLLGIRTDLRDLGTELEQIEETLKRILGEEKFQTWLAKANTIADSLAHVEADYEDYIEYTTPVASGPDKGQFPKIPKQALKDLAVRIYSGDGFTDQDAIAKIQQAIAGSGAGDGLVELFTRLLVDRLAEIPGDQLTSRNVANACTALNYYYLRLLAFQLNAVTLIIEAKRLDGFGDSVLEGEWKSFQDAIGAQQEIYLAQLWNVMAVLRGRVAGEGYQLYPYPIDNYIWNQGMSQLANDDLLAYLPGISASPGYWPKAADWYDDSYLSTLAAAEQGYLADAEAILAAFTLTSESSRRVVVHVLFYIGMTAADPARDVFRMAIPLAGSDSTATVDLHTSAVHGSFPFFWVRHVHELDKDGAYRMADLSGHLPDWKGYQGGVYRFQSTADLAVEAKVDADNPVGVIRFAPYVQAAS